MSNQVRVRATDLRADVATGDEVLNITLADGSIAVLIGPSDNEKSAWLDTLAGLRPPASGRLQLLDYDSRRRAVDERMHAHRGAAYLSADAPLLSTFDVRANVMLPHLYHFNHDPSHARHAADQLLDKLGFEGSRARLPAELDLFEKWQVLLARGLALDPAVLFIDEPFELHMTVRWPEIEGQLQKLARNENRTLVVATQNMGFARDADWIIHVESGDVKVLHGWAEVESASTPELDRFLQAVPITAAGEPAR